MSENENVASRETSKFRRILPATVGIQPVEQHPETSKRRVVAAACDECRRRKIKCSGDRPKCNRCSRRDAECHYSTEEGETSIQAVKRKLDTLQSKTALDQELLELLRNMPETLSQNALRQLRAGSTSQEIINRCKAGDPLIEMSVFPEIRLRYEFPYKPNMPASYLHDNPYLDSIIYEATSLYLSPERPTPDTTSGIVPEKYYGLYTKPFHAGKVIEPRLADAKPSAWTSICSDDVLMRDLLSVFLRCEYQMTAAFQKDLFLEDMASMQHDFCSSLLVNAVLAYACSCYTKFKNREEYWNPNTYTYRFIAEARRLWELEANEPRLTTIQAGVIFSVIHNLSGLDEVGRAYRIQAVALAHEMQLFDAEVDIPNDRIRHGTAYTAWALYNWESHVAFSFVHPPLLGAPPSWPLPDPTTVGWWYGEIWLKYPCNNGLLPMQFGHIFLAKSRFRIIMAEFCQMAYSKGSSLTLEVANDFFAQLKYWHSKLPEELQPRRIVLPSHLQLHIYFHHLTLSIYEPLLNENKDNEDLQAVINDAKKYLYTLTRLYFVRHGFEAMDLFIVTPLMLMGYNAVDALAESQKHSDIEMLRSTVVLAALGLAKQQQNHYLAEALFRVLRARLRPQELALLEHTVQKDKDRNKGRQELMQAVKSHWPVSVVKKAEDVDAYALQNLLESYTQLNLK